MKTTGFVPPPYPYDRLTDVVNLAKKHPLGILDCSIGTPQDPLPAFAGQALRPSDGRAYPPSIGTGEYLQAFRGWVSRSMGVDIDDGVGACVGTKEFVVSVAQYLRLRSPERDTVLYPSVSYPSYAMGATLAHCRAVPVRPDAQWNLDLDSISQEDRERALFLWVNSPGNPTGNVAALTEVAKWGRDNGVLILSDECYVSFLWGNPPASGVAAAGTVESIISAGTDGVLAVHSLSKRSNAAGVRIGAYCGDPEIVTYLSEVRKHAGLMPSGISQHLGAVLWDDDDHVVLQRERYRCRLAALERIIATFDVAVAMPEGAFYLWVAAPGGDAWGFAALLAKELGMVVSPGEFYGPEGSGFIRIAAVWPVEKMQAMAAARGITLDDLVEPLERGAHEWGL